MIAIRVPHPKFEIGQLVRHKRYGYRGVIVDIDATCQAPQDWYEGNRTQPERMQPWYHVLVDETETATYPAQSSLQADDSNKPVSNPMVLMFFTVFCEGRYERNEVPFQGWH